MELLSCPRLIGKLRVTSAHGNRVCPLMVTACRTVLPYHVRRRLCFPHGVSPCATSRNRQPFGSHGPPVVRSPPVGDRCSRTKNCSHMVFVLVGDPRLRSCCREHYSGGCQSGCLMADTAAGCAGPHQQAGVPPASRLRAAGGGRFQKAALSSPSLPAGHLISAT